MCEPVPDDPQDAVVAQEYKTNRKQYEITAKKWTTDYADWSKNEVKIKTIVDMGFDTKKAKESLIRANWDENQALQYLLDQ
mmetsp:Transcript_40707/g.36144  ORF Transcript_40707/g.36144 Transcript_40707/m.36144 type:complete len:81 (+) Transcript_40707:389-631(+)